MGLGAASADANDFEGWWRSVGRHSHFEVASQTIIRRAAKECFSLELIDFMKLYPSQVAMLGLQMIWTEGRVAVFCGFS